MSSISTVEHDPYADRDAEISAIDITDEETERMKPSELSRSAGELALRDQDIISQIIESRYYELKQFYGVAPVSAASQQSEIEDPRSPEESAECILQHLDNFRRGDEDHFIRTFSLDTKPHIELHDTFILALHEKYKNDGEFDKSFLRSIGECSEDGQAFNTERIVVTFDDMIITRTGIFDADDKPHSINYTAQLCGEKVSEDN